MNKRYTIEEREYFISKIKELYPKGYSQVDLSKLLCVSRGSIQRLMKSIGMEAKSDGEAGKQKTKKYNYIDDYFATINSENKAYVLGLLFGKAKIYDTGNRKRLVIVMKKEKKYLLDKIAFELNATELVVSGSFNDENWIEVKINSTKICNDLIKLGFNDKNKVRLKDFQPFFEKGLNDVSAH